MTNNKKVVWLLTMLLTVAIPSTWPQMVAASSATLADARLYWVGLSVPDAEASASWYQEKLHFTVKKRLVFPDHQLKIVFLELNGYTIELVENKAATSFDTVRKRIPEVKDRDKPAWLFQDRISGQQRGWIGCGTEACRDDARFRAERRSSIWRSAIPGGGQCRKRASALPTTEVNGSPAWRS